MSSKPSVEFETKCWGGDWEYILKTDRLKKVIDRNDYSFARKTLYINNPSYDGRSYRNEIEHYAGEKVVARVIDNFIFVNDYKDKVFKFFNIPLTFEQEKGYPYSISELGAIYFAQSEYLVHFASDAILRKKTNWISPGIALINSAKDIKSISPYYTGGNVLKIKREIESDNGKSPLVSGDEKDFRMHFIEYRENPDLEPMSVLKSFQFGDQCYLIRVSDFKKANLNMKNLQSEKNYTTYGGNLFEKRVDAWYRKNNYYRATIPVGTFFHLNWNNLRLFKKVSILIKKDLSFLFYWPSRIKNEMLKPIIRKVFKKERLIQIL